MKFIIMNLVILLSLAIAAIAQPTAVDPSQIHCKSGPAGFAIMPLALPLPLPGGGGVPFVVMACVLLDPASFTLTTDVGQGTTTISVKGGASGGSPVFVDQETPAGTIDGVNAAFTLSAVPNPSLSLQLFRNGVLLRVGVDYFLNGLAVQFVFVPEASDSLAASYRR